MDYQEIVNYLIKQFQKKGATAAEAFLEEGRTLQIRVRDGDIESMQQATAKGVGLRVFSQGKMAFVDSSNLTPETLDSLVEKGVALSQQTSYDKYNILPKPGPKIASIPIYDSSISKIPLEDKVNLAKKVEKLALEYHKLLKKSGGSSYFDGESTVYIANSEGISVNYKESYCSFGVEVIAEDKEIMQPGWNSSSARFFSELKSPEEVAGKAGELAVSLWNGKPVKSQTAPVVFDRRAGGTFLYGILSAINGERVYQKASFLQDMINKPIASELITIIDDGTLPKGLNSRPVDGEGVVTSRKLIVDKGVLKGYLYNTYSAAKSGTTSTGNATRGGYSSLPGIGPHNFFMLAGETNPDDMVKEIKEGLYVLGTQGGGANPVNGNFSTGAIGLWISEGKKTTPVANITLAGNMFDILKGIDAVGNDLELDRSIACPTFRVKQLTIGGV